MGNESLFGIAADDNRALPPADSKAGARPPRRDSSISLDDPVQIARQHLPTSPTDVVPEADEENSDQATATQEFDDNPSTMTQVFKDEPISASPVEDTSPTMLVSDPTSTPTVDRLQVWLEDENNNPILVRWGYGLPDVPGTQGTPAPERHEDDGLTSEAMSEDSATPQPEGLQTPKTWSPDSVTPGQRSLSESGQPSSADSRMLEQSVTDTDVSMVEAAQTAAPMTARLQVDADINREASVGASRGPRALSRGRRYLAQRGLRRLATQEISQGGRLPSAEKPLKRDEQDEKAPEGPK